jgi:hypothetical protein
MNRFDYSWVIGIVVIVVLAFMWKPIMGLYHNISNKATNKDQYERGKIVFYDTTRWGGPDSYKSCAMCHAADFTPDPNKQITMLKYKPGQPKILKNLQNRFGSNVLGTGDELYEAINDCVVDQEKLAGGRVSIQAPFMQDLLVYVSKQ